MIVLLLLVQSEAHFKQVLAFDLNGQGMIRNLWPPVSLKMCCFQAKHFSHDHILSALHISFEMCFQSVTSSVTPNFREGLDGGITKYRVFEVHWNIPDFLARLNNLKSGVRCWETVSVNSRSKVVNVNFLNIDDWMFVQGDAWGAEGDLGFGEGRQVPFSLPFLPFVGFGVHYNRCAPGTKHHAKCQTPPQFSMMTGCTWIWGTPVRISFGCTMLRFWDSACLKYITWVQVSLGPHHVQLKRQCQYVPVDLHFNERVKDLDKFVNVDRLKKDLAKNASFNMIWKIKVQNQSKAANHIMIIANDSV